MYYKMLMALAIALDGFLFWFLSWGHNNLITNNIVGLPHAIAIGLAFIFDMTGLIAALLVVVAIVEIMFHFDYYIGKDIIEGTLCLEGVGILIMLLSLGGYSLLNFLI